MLASSMGFVFRRYQVSFRLAWSVALLAPLTVSLASSQAQFETRAAFAVGEVIPYSLVVGDFNGDGIVDVAVVNVVQNTTGNVEILLGNGDGTFRMGATYPLTDPAVYAVDGSLRGNGILDLVLGVVGGGNEVYVMLGNGDGTFQAPVSYPTTAESEMIALGDFTGDGIIDIADLEGVSTQGVVCYCIEVLPGNGDGTFGAPIATIPVPYGIFGYSIAAGDFNGDDKLDVVVAGFQGSRYQADILLGNGNGTFTPDGFYPGASAGSIATGYFTGDNRKLDIALTTGGLAVMLGHGDGTFNAPVYYNENTSGASWVIAEDFNGDGRTDLAASIDGGPPHSKAGVTVLNGNGDGTFQKGVFYPVGTTEGGQFVATADFNGDHRPDLLVLNSVNGIITTLLNTGVVSFSPTTPLNFGNQAIGTTGRQQSVTLTNTGTTELKIQSMTASAEFGMKSTCGDRVAPGANCDIRATFSPTKQGAQTGTITITIIDNASSKPQVIELLGTGT
jgi:hypothetical protein